MSDRLDLTDDLIERALARRAPRGADAGLLDRVMADVAATSQALGWWPQPLADRFRGWKKPAGLAAVSGLTLIAVGAILGGAGSRPPLPAVVDGSRPPMTPVSSPSPSVSSDACTTDTIVVRVGDEMASMASDPLRIPADGVVLQGPGSRADVWVAAPDADPIRIATVDGPGVNTIRLLDRSPDGTSVLLDAGKVSPAGMNPECSDLYLIRTDGSAVTRLTHNGPGQYITGAAFSPDGATIAYASWDGISFVDLTTGDGRLEAACYTGYAYAARLTWAPTGDQLAVICQDRLMILDPTGVDPTRTVTDDGFVLAFGWSGENLVAARLDDEAAAHLRVDRIDGATGETEVGTPLDDAGIEWMIGNPGSLSPGGRYLLVEGGLVGSVPGALWQSGFYLIEIAGGPPRLILEPLDGFEGWTTDGRALLAADYRGDIPDLVRIDLETGDRTILGTTATSAHDAIWSVP